MSADAQRLYERVLRRLAELKGAAEQIPNMAMFVAMYVRKEALFSAQIEGTQATLDDILDPMVDANANRDVVEALDNVKAMLFAVEQLTSPEGLPLSMRLLRKTHEVLLTHSRGQNKNPGEFRRSQNWIGPTGCNLKEAVYVPPNPEDMDKALNDLELYFHNEDDPLPPLVRAALIHYQFETIHPFLDGNGRIGRLLITLFLLDKEVISAPYLYISYFMKLERTAYYEQMMSVRQNGTFESWIMFFLRAAEKAAEDAQDTIRKLQNLGKVMREHVVKDVKGPVAQKKRLRFLTYLEERPIIEIGRVAADLKWSFPTASKFVKNFVEIGILKEVTGRARSRVYAYDSYLKILRKDMDPL